ncbi:family 16 glycoside hydrolase [Nonomuraea insulae]|uniref:Family 16 glycoside hydrolase n=1 Tax=Nonomuraea insulae TaxID=1616787 RepID=A0ABW1DAI0_9ACTN
MLTLLVLAIVVCGTALLAGLVVMILAKRRRRARTHTEFWRSMERLGFVCTIVCTPIALVLAAVTPLATQSSPTASSAPAPSNPESSRASASSLNPSSSPSSSESSSPEESLESPAALPYTADWSQGIASWTETEGWRAVEGSLVNDGTSYSHEMTTSAPLILDDVSDYDVDADIQLLRYSDAGLISGYASFGLVVRAQDDAEGYGYGLGHCAASGLFSCGTGRAANFAAVLWPAEDQPKVIEATAFRPKSSWHHYRVEARGNELKLFIDGRLTLQVTDTRYPTGGRVGLWSRRAQINVKNFKVTAA